MKLLFLGDFYYDYLGIERDIESIGACLREQGYVIILNLEGALPGNAGHLKKGFPLTLSEYFIDVLQLLNVKAVNIANNHILDQQRDGFEKLLNQLDAANIRYFGAGLNLEMALNPVFLNIAGQKIGICGFGWRYEQCIYAAQNKPGVAPLKRNVILPVLEEIRGAQALPIVNLHWGYEFEILPLPVHRKLARELIDHGAELIIGHHPHVVQAVETYMNKHIFYSLGNFYFAGLRERYGRIKNIIAQQFSHRGLGVVYDIQRHEITHKYFCYCDGQSRITDRFELTDLSGISLSDYNKYYKKNLKHGFLTKKVSMYVGGVHRIFNPIRVLLMFFKWHLAWLGIYILKGLHVYDLMRKLVLKMKKR